MARNWGVLLAVGIIAVVLGGVLALWPGQTVAVVGFLLAFQLLVTGIAQLFLAGVSAPGDGAPRWAIAVAGLLTIAVGVLLLFRPLETLGFIGWAAGLCVIAIGASDLTRAVLSRGLPHRGWQAVRGAAGVVLGLALVANPHTSVGLLVFLACVWLVSYGIVSIYAAIVLRSEHRQGAPATAPG
jgi:uncharacterized membrane protein HdeD (DUF308 family)